MTTEQKVCEQHFITHKTQQQVGRFVVILLKKLDPKQLGTSRFSGEQRLHAIERRLERYPELKFQYQSFVKEYEELGYVQQVNSQEGR